MEAYGINASADQLDKLTTFYEMVVEKNKVMNLTGITEPEDFAVKHIIDSLSAYDANYFKKGSRCIDIGTGAGFPGIPLAIMHPEISYTLFDSLQKRLRFLEEVIEELALKDVKTLHGRAEDMGRDPQYREQFDIGTSRAVARLSVLLEWSLPFIKKGGTFIALKGAAYKEEQEEATHALSVLHGNVREVKDIKLPGLSDQRGILYIEKEKNTSKEFPRKPKEIKEKPL